MSLKPFVFWLGSSSLVSVMLLSVGRHSSRPSAGECWEHPAIGGAGQSAGAQLPTLAGVLQENASTDSESHHLFPNTVQAL